MPRAAQRHPALHFLLACCGWFVCVLVWTALLTFNPADWPSTSIWPQFDPPENWCGRAGAFLTYYAFYYLGIGVYALAALLTGGVAAWSHRAPLPDGWLRVIGAGLVCGVISTLGTLWLGPSERFVISGPGGIFGIAAANFLLTHLSNAGAIVTLLAALGVGLVLAADQAVIRAARWLAGVSRQAAPVIVRGGGEMISGAGAAVAGGIASVRGRLAPTPAVATSELPSRRASRTAGPAAAPISIPKQSPPRPDAIDDIYDEESPDEPAASAMEEADEEAEAPVARTTDPPPAPGPASKFGRQAVPEVDDDDEEGDSELIETKAVTAAARPTPRVTDLGARAPKPMALELPLKVGDYELPNAALLEDAEPIDKQAVEILCREKAYVLEQTLNEFRLEVQVVAIETGPVITVFELKLAPGIKVSQIASLTNDMARALKAPAVRVVAPLPGKNTIGLEVPNIDKERVRLKDLLRATGVRGDAFAIPLFLGKDASGAALVSDLARMPHMLIAGTTGSGKSVCISSIIMSVLLTRTPEEVQMVLVDPKVVELTMFKDIPHLMCPIVTEVSKAEAILDWAATKMDERYALLAEAGVKDIRSYNKLGKELLKERMQIETDEELAAIPLKLPYIVIVIDELADLMMTSAKEVEFYLCRLAQKSRAVGIHLIVSTQRPQANVVTGLIKSNLPCRVAFRVASRLDSRIVLDQNGGEVLMGQGDMLFLPPGQSKLMRAQGTFISDEELRAIVKHSRSQRSPQFHPELVRMPKLGQDAGERDELFDEAVGLILDSNRGSVSLLQRKLTIGYSRASRLIEQMYHAGIVGEYKGSQAREILMTKEEWVRVRNQRDAEDPPTDL